MADQPGTFERIAQVVGRALQSLELLLTTDNLPLLLVELGLDAAPSVTPDDSFLKRLSDTVDKVDALGLQLNIFAEATDQDDVVKILESARQIMVHVNDIVAALEALATDLKRVAADVVDPSVLVEFSASMAERIIENVLVRYFEDFHLVLWQILSFFTIIEYNLVEVSIQTEVKHVLRRRLYFDRITTLFSDPLALFREGYGWGTDALAADRLFSQTVGLANTLGLLADHINTEDGEPILDLFTITFSPTPKVNGLPPGIQGMLFTDLGKSSNITIAQLNDDWRVMLQLAGEFNAGLIVYLLPPTQIGIDGDIKVAGDVSLALVNNAVGETNPLTLFSVTGGPNLKTAGMQVSLTAPLSWDAEANHARSDIGFQVKFQNAALQIDSSDGDSFLQSILPSSGIRGHFDLSLGWTAIKGFYFDGSSTLEIRLPIHVDLGLVAVQALTATVEIQPINFPFSVGVDIKSSLGPLVAVIENMGATATFSFPESGGNLGPLDLEVGFKSPDGLGLSVDGGGFSGGGFLKHYEEDGRYEGTLELEFQDKLSLKAIGLLTTRLPGGKPGFSLLIIITAEFTPIQLGLGFTLNGVGGMLGLNRTADVDRLRSGVQGNSLSSVLFPQNVVENASRILSDLNQLFPAQPDRFIFGPMARIGWGSPTLVTIDLGLIIEVPEPIRIIILGVVRALLPDEDTKLLQLQVNFLGVIDFSAGRLSFDASLYNSQLLGLPLSGDMAVRLSWGADRNLLLTVGGFHPSYQPPPLNLPTLHRLSLHLTSGDNPRLTLEHYYAITSNTVQFGAKVELFAKAGSFSVYGFLSYDVLFQFNPFHFIASISGKLALLAGGSEIASISLDFTLEGPTPWHAHGTARLKICWFLTVSVSFDKTFGDARNTSLPDILVLPLLQAALSDPGNWEAQPVGGRQQLVSTRKIQVQDGDVIAAPFGTLIIQQKVVPLGIEIQRFGSQKPADGKQFVIQQVTVGTDGLPPTSNVQEQFAPAQFFEMTDADKLSSKKAFESYSNGVKLDDTGLLAVEYGAAREVRYEMCYIDEQRDLIRESKPVRPDGQAFHSWAVRGAVANSSLSQAAKGKSAQAPGPVQVRPEQFMVVNAVDLQPVQPDAPATNQAAAQQLMDQLIHTNPALQDTLLVLPQFEAKRL